MSFTEVMALVSASVLAAGTIYYIVATLRGTIGPVLASWIVIATTNALSFVTYWTTKEHSLVANVSNAAGAGSCIAILLAVALVTLRASERVSFSSFQRKSLLAAVGILGLWVSLVWGFGKTGLVPNLLTQILMVIGYIVTAEKLWYAKRVSEPTFTWACVAIACIVGLYPAIRKGDGLAILYGVRAILSAGTLVFLIKRIEYKQVPSW